MSSLENCFNLHSFNELNNIDYNKLVSFFNKFLENHKIGENSTFFDIGTNAGSFIKVLQRFNIYKNIHCFEPQSCISK